MPRRAPRPPRPQRSPRHGAARPATQHVGPSGRFVASTSTTASAESAASTPSSTAPPSPTSSPPPSPSPAPPPASSPPRSSVVMCRRAPPRSPQRTLPLPLSHRPWTSRTGTLYRPDWTLLLVTTLVTMVMLCPAPGTALLCFHCNSAGRPSCGDPFDPEALEPLACHPPPTPGAAPGAGPGPLPAPHPDAEPLPGGGNATATLTHEAHYTDYDAPPVVRCLKEERAVSESESVVLRTCVLVAEDTPSTGCSSHPAALHCSLCEEDECNAAFGGPPTPPAAALAVAAVLLALLLAASPLSPFR